MKTYMAFELTPKELRAEIEHAVETALDRRLADLDVLREVMLLAQGILSAHLVGRLLGVTARTVTERYVPQGLKVYRVGQTPLFLTEDLVEFVKAHAD